VPHCPQSPPKQRLYETVSTMDNSLLGGIRIPARGHGS